MNKISGIESRPDPMVVVSFEWKAVGHGLKFSGPWVQLLFTLAHWVSGVVSKPKVFRVEYIIRYTVGIHVFVGLLYKYIYSCS